MPKKLTAATGFDALAHAVESYVTPLANEFTEALSLKAVSLIFKWLLVAYREPDNMTARHKVHVAATLAGMAFSNSGLGVAHSIAHAIGGLFNIPHGVAVGVALPYSVLFNANHTEKYCDLAEALKLKYSTPVDAAKEFAQKLFELRRELESSLTLKEAGIPEKEFLDKLDIIAEKALEDPSTPYNPRSVTLDDLKTLLKVAYYGDSLDKLLAKS